MFTEICKKPESSQSFSYENTVTERTSLKSVITVQRDERVLSLAHVD